MKSGVRNQSESSPIGHVQRVQSSPGGLGTPDDRTRTRTRTPDPVAIDRHTLRDLIAIARRSVRTDEDLDTVHRAQLIARTIGGAR